MRVLDTTTPTSPSPNTAAEISPLDPGNRISFASSAVMQPSRLVGLGPVVDVLAAVPGISSLPPEPAAAAARTIATATGHAVLTRLAARRSACSVGGLPRHRAVPDMRFMMPEPRDPRTASAPRETCSHERRQHGDQGRDRLSERASPQSPRRDEEHDACHDHAATGEERQRPASRLVPGVDQDDAAERAPGQEQVVPTLVGRPRPNYRHILLAYPEEGRELAPPEQQALDHKDPMWISPAMTAKTWATAFTRE